MPILHAIVLGLVQGLTEFLPISSSGHLILVPWLFGWHDFGDAAVEKAFDVALHIGTLVAMVAYFRRDLSVYVRAGVETALHRDRPATRDGKLAWLLLLSSIPAAIAGALFSDAITDHLGKPVIIAVSLIVGGLLLGWADRAAGRRKLDDYGLRDSLTIGAAQVLALNPGTSRSGITITAGRFVGLDRDAAARASFLMAVPVTLGAIVFEMAKLVKDGIPSGLGWPMTVGIVTSGVSGLLAVWGLMRFVRTHSFRPFVVYRVIAGMAVLIVAATSFR
ncbi:MAG: undecaprenyl-diphosphate phosphatase [Ilumatobacteraceae bacterium]